MSTKMSFIADFCHYRTKAILNDWHWWKGSGYTCVESKAISNFLHSFFFLYALDEINKTAQLQEPRVHILNIKSFFVFNVQHIFG